MQRFAPAETQDSRQNPFVEVFVAWFAQLVRLR